MMLGSPGLVAQVDLVGAVATDAVERHLAAVFNVRECVTRFTAAVHLQFYDPAFS